MIDKLDEPLAVIKFVAFNAAPKIYDAIESRVNVFEPIAIFPAVNVKRAKLKLFPRFNVLPVRLIDKVERRFVVPGVV